MADVFIPLNAFSVNENLPEDLYFYISMIADSKADGIEIRRELMRTESIHSDILKISQLLPCSSLSTVYSAPIPLWNEHSLLNEKYVTMLLEECQILNANWLKLPLGHYQVNKSNLFLLQTILNQYKNIQLLIENDQTLEGGTIHHLLSFFENASKEGVWVKMTFDLGNWAFLHEDAQKAALLFKSYVAYYHLKHVIKKGHQLITVPVSTEEKALWKEVEKEFPLVPKALEFPISPSVNELNRYIDIVKGI